MAGKQKISIEEATERFLVDRSDFHRDRLVELLTPWIRGIAKKVKHSLATKLEVEDLEQLGAMGLIDALRRFNGSVPLTVYAMLRVKGAMIDACRTDCITPRLVQRSISKVFQAEQSLTQELGHKPTEEELLEACPMPREELKTVRHFRQAALQVPIVPTFRHSEEDDHEVPTAADVTTNPPDDGERRRQFVRRVLSMLSQRERLLLIGLYFEDQTMKEVANGLGLSESRISQMHTYLMGTLREVHKPNASELFELARAS